MPLNEVYIGLATSIGPINELGAHAGCIGKYLRGVPMFDGKLIHKWSIFHSDAASYRIIKYYDCNHKQMKIHMHIYTHVHITTYKHIQIQNSIMVYYAYVCIDIHLHIWFPHVSPCL
jgi:hypothetical protein